MMKRLFPILVALAGSACGPAAVSTVPAAPVPSAPPPSAGPTSTIAKFFPLLQDHIYQYVTESDGGQGVMMTRVTRADSTSGDLQGPRGTKTFRYVSDGVVLATESTMPIYVLKKPFAVGTEWRGHGGSIVKIVEVGASITVPAGTYEGCIKTLEQRGGDRPMRVTTSYCPEVGIVQLEAASGMVMERAVLKSYGPPLDLGPDGVRTFPPDETPPAPQ